MKGGYRLPAFVLELDPVDVLLIASAFEYVAQVRDLLRRRQQNRRRIAEQNEGVEKLVEHLDAAAAGGPDYAAEAEALGPFAGDELLVEPTRDEPVKVLPAVRVRDNPQA